MTFFVLIIVLAIWGEHPGVYIIVYEHNVHLTFELYFSVAYLSRVKAILRRLRSDCVADCSS